MRQAAQEATTHRIGDYQLTAILPSTSAGVVEFEGTHVMLPRRARIRVLEHAAMVIDAIAKAMMREACVLEALHHAGFPRVYECGVLDDRRVWIASELLDGSTLEDSMVRPLHELETLALLRDLAEILHHAHVRGVVHCRLRPELIVRQPTGLVITSWADAHTHDAPKRPHLGPEDRQIFLAPEIARDDVHGFDHRADIYSLGVIAYKALTLEAPTIPLARRQLALPSGLISLVERMISNSPLARPSASEVRAEAIRLLDISTELNAETIDDLDGTVIEIELEITQDLAAGTDTGMPVHEEDEPPTPPVMRARWTPHDNIYTPPQPPPLSASESRRKPC